MTEFLKPRFHVALGSESFRANYDKVFGRRAKDVPEGPKVRRPPRAKTLERRVAEGFEHRARQAYGSDAGEND